MANNDYVNKVTLANGAVLLDVSQDTAVQEDVAAGKFFHLATGQRVQGTNNKDFPPGGDAGDLLAKRTNADYDFEWVTPANSPEQDNTRPITAAAVYTTVGNINALLATI